MTCDDLLKCTESGKAPFDREAFSDDLVEIAERHGVTDMAVCGTDPKGNFFGCVVSRDNKVPFSMVFPVTLNVGRLWQYMREQARDLLNTFEVNKKDW